MSKTVNGVVTPFTWDTAGSTPLLLSDGTTDYIYGANGAPIEQETVRPAITWIGDSTATAGTGATTLTVNFPSGVQANDQVFLDTSQSAANDGECALDIYPGRQRRHRRHRSQRRHVGVPAHGGVWRYVGHPHLRRRGLGEGGGVGGIPRS